jgi:hypothetical protein
MKKERFFQDFIAAASPIPNGFVLDIAIDEIGLSVMEVGCINCAGLYDCDLVKVVNSITEVIEK